MKLKDYLKSWSKQSTYELYIRLIYEIKDYEKITKNKMIDDIVDIYHEPNYLFNICTEKEIKFLKKIREGKLSLSDSYKYYWEINELNEKTIIGYQNEIYEELIDCVDEALSIKIGKKERSFKDFNVFVVGFVKTHASVLYDILKSVIQNMYTLDDENIDIIFCSPFIHFYCNICDKWLDTFKEYREEIYYRNYYDLLDDIDAARIQYGRAGSIPFYIELYSDMFYYGMPMDNPKTNKLYKTILKEDMSDYLFHYIDFARLINEQPMLEKIFDGKLLSVVKDGFMELPCACMNGFTPRQYEADLEEEMINNKRFTHVKQNDAHLVKKAADEFYKIYFALLEYTNNKYKVNNNINKIYKQEGLNARELKSINDYLFDNKQILDEFVEDNCYKFNKEELDIVSGFKTAIKGDNLVVVGYERDYTKILSSDGKIYMVKGVRDNIDKVLKNFELPVIINTTLLMFKDKIIYNGFISSYQINIGNDIKKLIIKDSDKAIEYYHL